MKEQKKRLSEKILKVCQEKTLDTMPRLLYDSQGDDEWKDL